LEPSLELLLKQLVNALLQSREQGCTLYFVKSQEEEKSGYRRQFGLLLEKNKVKTVLFLHSQKFQ